MKKETIVALILGTFAGTLIAILLLFAVKETSLRNKKVLSPQTSPSLKKDIETIAQLKINSPQKDTIINTDTTTIKGQGQKDSLIIALSPAGSASTKIKEKNFEVKIPLLLGENTIRITSYYKNNSDEEIIKIYYIDK